MALIAADAAKFTDINPGSKVRVEAVDPRAFASYEGQVMQLIPEFGANNVPALVVKQDGQDPQLVIANGTARVTVLIDSGILAANVVPDEAIHVRQRPTEADAIKFTGGVNIASTIIRFAAGKAVVQWIDRTESADEHLLLMHLGSQTQIHIGDWIMQDEEGNFTGLTEKELNTRFEKIDRA